MMTQNAWFRGALCAAISGEISILIQTGAESWGRFPVPRICRWESKLHEEKCDHYGCSSYKQDSYTIIVTLQLFCKLLQNLISLDFRVLYLSLELLALVSTWATT